MVDEGREVRVGGVEGRATTWNHAGEVSPVGDRHVAVPLAVPEGDWKVERLEIEPPRPSEKCQVPHRATGPLRQASSKQAMKLSRTESPSGPCPDDPAR